MCFFFKVNKLIFFLFEEREKSVYVLSNQVALWFSTYLQKCHWATLFKNWKL